MVRLVFAVVSGPNRDSITVTGNKLLQTFDRLEIAEFTARSIIMGHPLGELLPMIQDQIDEMIGVFGQAGLRGLP